MVHNHKIVVVTGLFFVDSVSTIRYMAVASLRSPGTVRDNDGWGRGDREAINTIGSNTGRGRRHISHNARSTSAVLCFCVPLKRLCSKGKGRGRGDRDDIVGIRIGGAGVMYLWPSSAVLVFVGAILGGDGVDHDDVFVVCFDF
jgi:hypothetical protein